MMKRGKQLSLFVASSLFIFTLLLTLGFASAEITVNGAGNFSSINEALVNASNGDVIEISNGTYFENITINKRITLRSRDGADITELEGSITIDFDDVKVSELSVSNPSGAYAILVNSNSDDAIIENNIVHNVGTSTIEDHVQAIYIVGGDDHVVRNNTIFDVVSSSLSGSAKGIFAGGSSGITSDLKVLNNTIFDINSARGAYGILVNRESTRLEISGNEIYDVVGGLWAHAISLDADTLLAIVKNNLVYDVLGNFLGFGVSVNVEENDQAETIKIFNNSLLSGVGVLNQMNLSEINAENNWWGACNGPSGFDNNGSGSASVGTPFGNVDFIPWIGTCVEEKTVDPICSIASKNLTLIANVTSNLCIGDVIFGVVINGSEMNFTGVPSLSGIGNYEFEIDNSLLEGGFLDWNVYAEDCYGHFNWTSQEQKYVFSETKISVSPSEPNGKNGWYISEPIFTLTNPDANATNTTIYKWDSGPEYNYTSPFGLENITNFPPISAGILDIRYKTNICEEPFQVLDIKVDLVAPQFIDLKPVDGANLTKNDVEIQVYIDEVFQSNSGINTSTIVLKVDDATVSPTINQIGIDALVKFNATNLSNGKHNVSVSAEDKAGNFNSTIWEFNISSKPIFNLILNSPSESLYSERRIKVNFTSESEVDRISYFDFTDDKIRERIICRRDCENYGNDKERYITLKDGFRNLTFVGLTPDGEYDNESSTFIIDTKTPKILKTEPRRGFSNGTFFVEIDEENVNELIINYGNNLTGFRFDEINVSECSSGKRGHECPIEVNLSDYDGEEIEYWFNVTDIVGNSATSKENEIEADTTLPVLNSFNYTLDGRRVSFVFNVTEANFDEIIYRDNNSTLEKSICTRLKGEICERRISFKDGEHNLSILIKDEAGNSVNESANFFIN